VIACCVPVIKAVVVKLAVPPDKLTMELPASATPPSSNVTVPVGVPAPGDTAPTVAVKVTACPWVDGFREEMTEVVVSALLTVSGALAVLPECTESAG
jgi:hypothetical protein